jgi:ParB-like chromosome segregation protein Spo0J
LPFLADTQAARHRLAAFSRLGLERIPCFNFAGDALAAKIWELDENLCRNDLTEDERRETLAKRALLTQERISRVCSGVQL